MPNVDLPQAEFKVVLLGDTNTGKTSLALRFVEGYYRDGHRSPTVGAFFFTKRITITTTTGQEMTMTTPSSSCKLLLWDTAGQSTFARLAQTYYQTAAAAILTYDVSQPQSLHRLRTILTEVLANTADRRIVIAIAACKNDLDPSLHAPGLQEEAQRLADQHDAIYVTTSALNNQGVTVLFEQTAERVWQAYREAAAGSGLPIPVQVGWSVWQKQQKQQHLINNRQMGAAVSPASSMQRSESAPLKRTSGRPKTLAATRRTASELPHGGDNNTLTTGGDCAGDSDTTAGDSVDDFVQEADQGIAARAGICEGALTGCVGSLEDTSKGCCIS